MKSHCLVLGFIAIVAYVSAQDFNRAKRMSLAVIGTDKNNSKDEFHQKVVEAKQSLKQQQIDPQQIDLSSKFLDCVEQGQKGMIACHDETVGQLSDEKREKFYELFNKIAPSAADNDDE